MFFLSAHASAFSAYLEALSAYASALSAYLGALSAYIFEIYMQKIWILTYFSAYNMLYLYAERRVLYEKI